MGCAVRSSTVAVADVAAACVVLQATGWRILLATTVLLHGGLLEVRKACRIVANVSIESSVRSLKANLWRLNPARVPVSKVAVTVRTAQSCIAHERAAFGNRLNTSVILVGLVPECRACWPVLCSCCLSSTHDGHVCCLVQLQSSRFSCQGTSNTTTAVRSSLTRSLQYAW